MSQFLKGKIFKNNEEVNQGMKSFFGQKDANFYRHGIEQLPARWREVLARHGDYIRS
jgi:hypothetical protein